MRRIQMISVVIALSVRCVFLAADEPAAPVLKRANEIVIPKLTVRDVSVRRAVHAIRVLSVQASPDGMGINVIVDLKKSRTPVKIPDGLDEELSIRIQNLIRGTLPHHPYRRRRKLTLGLHDVPVLDAVKYVSTLANLSWRMQGDTIIVGYSQEHLEVRVYKLRSEFFGSLARTTRETKGETNEVVVSLNEVKGGLEAELIIERRLFMIIGGAEKFASFEELASDWIEETYK